MKFFYLLTVLVLIICALLIDGILLATRGEAFSPFIAFQSDRNDGWHIYRMRYDGSDIRELTHSYDQSPAWSPDGKQIAFQSFVGRPQILVMAASGGKTQIISPLNFIAGFPTWSPDGKWIAFISLNGTDGTIYRVQPDGSNLERMLDQAVDFEFMEWSPDGNWIAFIKDQGIHILNVETREVRRLASDTYAQWGLRWMPDSQAIVYTADKNNGGGYDIYRLYLDGSPEERLTHTSWDESLAMWSPDKRWVVFSSWKRRNLDIYRAPADANLDTVPFSTDARQDSKLVPLAESSLSSEWVPVWSPIIDYPWHGEILAAVLLCSLLIILRIGYGISTTARQNNRLS